MKTSIQILSLLSFLCMTGVNFIHAQSTCTLTITPSTTISKGNCTTLNASLQSPTCSGIYYGWSPVSGLNNPYSSNPVACPSSTTTYTVNANGAGCCYGYMASVTVTVVTSTGVLENNFLNQIHVYPNPFTESTTIHIDDAQLIPAEFKIYDLLGKELKNYKIQNAEMKIFRDNLSSGLYYYGLFRKGQIVGIGKLMVE